jgi:S-adenosyl-L-methionine hydrolase (adenosine-forming)
MDCHRRHLGFSCGRLLGSLVVFLMPDPIITLTTDFGADSPYVAAMKGVILAINPAARLVDLSHQIWAQCVRHAAFFLAQTIPHFPPEVIHVVVVDPGVGTERALLYVEIDGHRILAPDNGCWTILKGTPRMVIRLTERKYWREVVSNTFHGRDILAPVAAHLSQGVDPALLGPELQNWEKLEMPAPVDLADGVGGEVIFIDHFGNLITNIPASLVQPGRPTRLIVGGRECPNFVWARAYADVELDEVVLLISSSGFVEIAVNQGSAAHRFGSAIGTPVLVGWK